MPKPVNLMPLAADGRGRIQNDDVASDKAIKEMSQRGQVKFLCRRANGHAVEVVTDVLRGNLVKLQVL